MLDDFLIEIISWKGFTSLMFSVFGTVISSKIGQHSYDKIGDTSWLDHPVYAGRLFNLQLWAIFLLNLQYAIKLD